jgi:hypothetical protein
MSASVNQDKNTQQNSKINQNRQNIKENQQNIKSLSKEVKSLSNAVEKVSKSFDNKANSAPPLKESNTNNKKTDVVSKSAPKEKTNSTKKPNARDLWRKATKQAYEEIHSISNYKAVLEKHGLDPLKLLLMKNPEKHPNLPKDHPSILLYKKSKEIHEELKRKAGIA